MIDGKRGLPVSFQRSCVGSLLSPLTGDEGGRSYRAEHGNEVELIPVDDPGVTHDLDRLGGVMEEVSRRASRVR